ncbi:MAG: hypothetical protein ACI4HQ_07990 [Acetatifactor sp.]
MLLSVEHIGKYARIIKEGIKKQNVYIAKRYSLCYTCVTIVISKKDLGLIGEKETFEYLLGSVRDRFRDLRDREGLTQNELDEEN